MSRPVDVESELCLECRAGGLGDGSRVVSEVPSGGIPRRGSRVGRRPRLHRDAQAIGRRHHGD